MINSELNYSKSFTLHIALVLGFLGFHFFNFSFRRDHATVVPKKVFIKQAIRVDVVGMPKHTLKELKAMKNPTNQIESAPAKETAPPAKVAPDESDFLKQKKKASFKDLIKGLSNKKVDQPKQVTKSNSNTKSGNGEGKNLLSDNQLKKLILEGNKISKGSSLTGVQVTQNNLGEFENYIVTLPDHVRPYWKLPSYLLDKKLQCRIQVYINAAGDLVRASLVESSGDSEYDSKAMQAVKAAAPFPRPDASIVSKLIQGEVILGFPL